jgi:glucose/arabinose dehydrogenase
MLFLKGYFYVANTDGLWRFPYRSGQTKLNPEDGEFLLTLPAGKHNRHWTRNIIANAAGTKIYIAVGSGSNHGENGIDQEMLKACILEVNPDGSGLRVYASGLRNPVGMDWEPETRKLWTAVNERDELGDDLVPDYLTSVKEGGFYGWPYIYHGIHEDPRVKDPIPPFADDSIIPDVDLGAHTASLGLVFSKSTSFPNKYREGAFVAQHGSWNRSTLSGYKIVFIPFNNGKPTGKPQVFMDFVADLKKDKVYGRPVGLAMLEDGSLLIADDTNGMIWRVSASPNAVVRR